MENEWDVFVMDFLALPTSEMSRNKTDPIGNFTPRTTVSVPCARDDEKCRENTNGATPSELEFEYAGLGASTPIRQFD